MSTCDVCDCEQHVNQPCVNCLNCVGYFAQSSDWDQDHSDDTCEHPEDAPTKPRYKYNVGTGEITAVDHWVAESFGL